MKTFQVWLRPLGDFCRVRVVGIENVRRLMDRLSSAFIFRTFEPVHQIEGSQHCTFSIPLNPPLTSALLRKLVSAIPEVELLRELA